VRVSSNVSVPASLGSNQVTMSSFPFPPALPALPDWAQRLLRKRILALLLDRARTAAARCIGPMAPRHRATCMAA
jgi:hypothetical protein